MVTVGDTFMRVIAVLEAMLEDADIGYNHGLCLPELGRPADAVAPLKRALRIDPGYTNAMSVLGVALARARAAPTTRPGCSARR